MASDCTAIVLPGSWAGRIRLYLPAGAPVWNSGEPRGVWRGRTPPAGATLPGNGPRDRGAQGACVNATEAEHRSDHGGERLSATSLEASTLLLRRARGGDLEARDRILARYYPKLLRWASGRLPPQARSLSDTADLVQEVIFKAIRNLPHLEIPAHGGLLPYLRTAIRNLVRDQVRNARRHGRQAQIDDHDEELADRQPSPLEEALGRDAFDRYETALERLPSDDRAAVLLRLELDCNWGLIAKELGKPSAAAARMAASRALLRLAQEMSHER